MKAIKKIFLLMALSIAASVANAQTNEPVTWAFSLKKINGKEAILRVTCQIATNWYIYATDLQDGGRFEPASGLLLQNATRPLMVLFRSRSPERHLKKDLGWRCHATRTVLSSSNIFAFQISSLQLKVRWITCVQTIIYA
jgi:hypothetical protein